MQHLEDLEDRVILRSVLWIRIRHPRHGTIPPAGSRDKIIAKISPFGEYYSGRAEAPESFRERLWNFFVVTAIDFPGKVLGDRARVASYRIGIAGRILEMHARER